MFFKKKLIPALFKSLNTPPLYLTIYFMIIHITIVLLPNLPIHKIIDMKTSYLGCSFDHTKHLLQVSHAVELVQSSIKDHFV